MSTIYLKVEMAVASRDFAVLHSGLASRLTTRSRPSTELDHACILCKACWQLPECWVPKNETTKNILS